MQASLQSSCCGYTVKLVKLSPCQLFWSLREKADVKSKEYDLDRDMYQSNEGWSISYIHNSQRLYKRDSGRHQSNLHEYKKDTFQSHLVNFFITIYLILIKVGLLFLWSWLLGLVYLVGIKNIPVKGIHKCINISDVYFWQLSRKPIFCGMMLFFLFFPTFH